MKNNNKGITLVEVMIGLSILGFVISASYKVIIGINSFINIQKEINSTVSSINILDKYLINDIQQSKSISDIEILNDESYKYTIAKNDIDVEYIVKNHKVKNKNVYDLIRKKGSTEVAIIQNLRSFEDRPFTIDKWKYDELYNVRISYKSGKKHKEKVLKLSTRLID